MKQVLITGATSGFGKAMAYRFAKENHNLIITGRRENRLKEIKDDIQAKYGVTVTSLCFDVRDEKSVNSAISSVQDSTIDILINNAGLALGLDKFQDADVTDWEQMIDTNIKGLLYVSKAVVPILLKQGFGHIINIGSTAGKEAYLKGNVYSATKHAVDAISKSMRIDLLGTNIKVTQICPGAAETEFSLVRLHGDTDAAKHVYEGYKPMTAEDIAEVTFYTTTLPPNLCVNDLVLTSISQANSFYTYKV